VAGITNVTGATELNCTTTAINVTATGGGSYAWDAGTAGVNPEDRIFTEAGTYTVTVTAAHGCTDYLRASNYYQGYH
jgi:PKD repeat protein